jgi:carbamoyl-phosphate synthase large subunit
MKNEFNILFSSAGRRVSLIRLFRKSLEKLGLKGKLIAADLSKTAPAMHVADIKYPVPRVTDPEYVPRLMEVCKKERVRLLIPLIDPELPLLARARGEFEDINTTINISSPETADIASDKRSTFQFFRSIDVSTPWLYEYKLKDKSFLDKVSFPVIIKPSRGSASMSIYLAHDPEELFFYASRVEQPVLQQYISGREYTTDVLLDTNQKVICAIPRMRLEVRAGEVSKGMTVRQTKVIQGVKKIAENLPGAFGVMNIQCFEDEDGELFFSEINARFGGGFPLAYRAGADLPKWLIQTVLGQKVKEATASWQEGLVMLRYDDEIWTDRQNIR